MSKPIPPSAPVDPSKLAPLWPLPPTTTAQEIRDAVGPGTPLPASEEAHNQLWPPPPPTEPPTPVTITSIQPGRNDDFVFLSDGTIGIGTTQARLGKPPVIRVHRLRVELLAPDGSAVKGTTP